LTLVWCIPVCLFHFKRNLYFKIFLINIILKEERLYVLCNDIIQFNSMLVLTQKDRLLLCGLSNPKKQKKKTENKQAIGKKWEREKSRENLEKLIT